MDPVERVDIAGDSTFALGLEAQARGHRLLYYGPRDLTFRDGAVTAVARSLDVRAVKDRPSTLEVAGQPADVASFMPLVLINPQVTPLGDPVTGPEGCLSFPEVYGDITRSESVSVAALNDAGEGIEFKAGGLLARVIQHEADHLNGILFIDRMSAEAKNELKPQLESLQNASKAALQKK